VQKSPKGNIENGGENRRRVGGMSLSLKGAQKKESWRSKGARSPWGGKIFQSEVGECEGKKKKKCNLGGTPKKEGGTPGGKKVRRKGTTQKVTASSRGIEKRNIRKKTKKTGEGEKKG